MFGNIHGFKLCHCYSHNVKIERMYMCAFACEKWCCVHSSNTCKKNLFAFRIVLVLNNNQTASTCALQQSVQQSLMHPEMMIGCSSKNPHQRTAWERMESEESTITFILQGT